MAWTVYQHNEMRRVLMRGFIRETIQRGANPAQVLTLLEDVAAGVICATTRLEGRQGNEDRILKQVTDGAATRIKDIRNSPVEV